ncbi:hypothetical protein POPTR_007G132501v4 [Populus trichocarpa]|uniref:Uncharacterized protein n=1 Tax=Populus trichocarpa TaxID=3694 RepID=A0ACC0SR92_POPTR|nr:hypothetical protein POPTR_007G132501v4 [Populus trichocarpa]
MFVVAVADPKGMQDLLYSIPGTDVEIISPLKGENLSTQQLYMKIITGQ